MKMGFIKVDTETEPKPETNNTIFVFSITDSDDDMVGDRDVVDVEKLNNS